MSVVKECGVQTVPAFVDCTTNALAKYFRVCKGSSQGFWCKANKASEIYERNVIWMVYCNRIELS